VSACESEKCETLRLRIKPSLCRLIDHAAALSGKGRTDFVLEAARSAAHEAILDQTVFVLDSKAYKKFLELLDAPPRPNARLRRLLQTPACWEDK
jgi:uncharacterized protein (DUF1778 family)